MAVEGKPGESDLSSISEEQPKICLEHQCSKRYLMSMLQDPPDPKYPYSFNNNTTSPNVVNLLNQTASNPLQMSSLYLGISSDGQQFLILPSNISEPASKMTVPIHTPTVTQSIQFPSTSSKSANEVVMGIGQRELPRDTDSPNEKPRKGHDGDSSSKREPELGARCNCRLSMRSSKFHCNEFTEEERKALFSDFWKLDWGQRKSHICFLVKCGFPNARRRACRDPSRKEFAFQYFLKKGNERLRVCKVMFLTTFGIGDAFVRDWVLQRHKRR